MCLFSNVMFCCSFFSFFYYLYYRVPHWNRVVTHVRVPSTKRIWISNAHVTIAHYEISFPFLKEPYSNFIFSLLPSEAEFEFTEKKPNPGTERKVENFFFFLSWAQVASSFIGMISDAFKLITKRRFSLIRTINMSRELQFQHSSHCTLRSRR